MSTPPYIEVTFDPPLSSDSNDDFDSKAFDTIGKLNPWGGEANDLADWVGTKADQALAAAIGGDLPELTDKGGEFLRVKADESGAEFVDISTVVPSQSTSDWEAGTSTDEGVVSPAKVKAAIDALADVGANYAALSAEAIGSVGFFRFTDGSIDPGQTTSGSNLKWASLTGGSEDIGDSPAGTWMALSYHDDSADRFGVFKRVS